MRGAGEDTGTEPPDLSVRLLNGMDDPIPAPIGGPVQAFGSRW
jgi:hypothetical protein